MPIKNTIICMKWGTLYSADYVNVLFNAAKRHMKAPFRFVCVTDDDVAISKDIECFPIPDIGLEQKHWHNGAWPKLAVFLPKHFNFEGRCLFIDLDSIILKDLDSFFKCKDPLVAIDMYDFSPSVKSHELMSSIFAFDADSLGYIVENIKSNRDALIAKFQVEQTFLGDQVPNWVGWPKDWVLSFKYELRQPLLLDRFLPPKSPPASAKFIAFHGRPRPIDIILPKKGNWDRFPHYGSGVVQWARTYWIENGGAV